MCIQSMALSGRLAFRVEVRMSGEVVAQALFAYPLHQNERSTRALWKELLSIHAAEMPAVFQQAKDYC